MAQDAGLLLYCRPGFEKECAGEIQEKAAAEGLPGYVIAREGDGYLLYQYLGGEFPRSMVDFRKLIFARQILYGAVRIEDLPVGDRAAPLIERATAMGGPYSAVWLETADTNEGKALNALTRRFGGAFLQAARAAGLMTTESAAPRLHLLFLDSTTVILARSDPANSAPWPMGIPRLKFPHGAPSRSTLKLEEAILTFVRDPQRRLAPAMTAVDLGAAPGGWTWQLVRRHLRVIAVDNGGLQQDLLESGLVEHVRADAFRYRPAKCVDWLVCDVVEQPARIAALIGRWAVEGWCRQAIFNLKLPMKKRYLEVQRCARILEEDLAAKGIAHRLQFKQLYHDREEVTGYLDLSGSS
jgi:23S rRNA (cytidine2498-2'-O)-methyltransferase